MNFSGGESASESEIETENQAVCFTLTDSCPLWDLARDGFGVSSRAFFAVIKAGRTVEEVGFFFKMRREYVVARWMDGGYVRHFGLV